MRRSEPLPELPELERVAQRLRPLPGLLLAFTLFAGLGGLVTGGANAGALSPTVGQPGSWRDGGTPRHLSRGAYRWIVLPIRGRASDTAGEAIVASRLLIG